MKITSDSHLDHGLSPAQVDYIAVRFADRLPPTPTATVIETFDLPAELGKVDCALYGPLMGDPPIAEAEVTWKARGARGYTSRLIARPARPTSTITVIMGVHQAEPCILYTAFGGPLAPFDGNDPRLGLASRSVCSDSETFWAEHALAEST